MGRATALYWTIWESYGQHASHLHIDPIPRHQEFQCKSSYFEDQVRPMFSCWSPFCVLKCKHQEINAAFNSQKRNLHFTKLPIRIIYLPFFRFLNVGIFGSTYRNLAVYLSRDTFHKANKINYQTINFHFKVKQRNS